MPRALIALGSNLGDRAGTIRAALARLPVLAASRLYETDPRYVLDQPPFLNAAAVILAEEPPAELLRRLKALETELGRVPGARYGPRALDLDLIAYEGESGEWPGLTLPHPRAAERRFVLAPAAEVAPDWELPGFGPVSALLAICPDAPESVRPVEG